MVGWLGGWVAGWLGGWVAGWLGGWAAGRLGGWAAAGRLGGWAAGRLCNFWFCLSNREIHKMCIYFPSIFVALSFEKEITSRVYIFLDF